MAARICVGLFLLSLSGVHSGANITILSLPVNLTSWRTSIRDALNYSLSHPLEGISKRFQGLVDFSKNGSVDCTAEGEECIPDVPSCCPGYREDDNVDLQCLPEGDYFLCGRPSSSEELTKRFDALQYGDSMGMADSHPWANSWAFESRSEAEKEEAKIDEEEEWKKNYVPDNTDNVWVKIYKKIKSSGKGLWNDIKKFKKLEEVKANLIERYNKRTDNTGAVKPQKVSKGEENVQEETEKERELLHPEEVPVEEKEEQSGVSYFDEISEESKDAHEQAKSESDESIIKFSDELPKREKKIDFRIDDIVKDAVKFVDKKFKRKEKPNKYPCKKDKQPSSRLSSSEEIPFHLDDIKNTEKKLIKELKKLKNMKLWKENRRGEHKLNEPDIEEMIRRQVATILEEERKLDKYKKIEELKRLEEIRNQKR